MKTAAKESAIKEPAIREPVYIEIHERKPPVCGFDSCIKTEHRVRVRVGPDLLTPFRTLLSVAQGCHDAIINGTGMAEHRKRQPDCLTCKAIREAQTAIEAVKGGWL